MAEYPTGQETDSPQLCSSSMSLRISVETMAAAPDSPSCSPVASVEHGRHSGGQLSPPPFAPAPTQVWVLGLAMAVASGSALPGPRCFSRAARPMLLSSASAWSGRRRFSRATGLVLLPLLLRHRFSRAMGPALLLLPPSVAGACTDASSEAGFSSDGCIGDACGSGATASGAGAALWPLASESLALQLAMMVS